MTPPRIRLPGPEALPPSLRERLGKAGADGSGMDILLRSAAAAPLVAETLAAHLDAIREGAEVPATLKALLAVRVSSLQHCRLLLQIHTAEARRLGAREHWLLAVRHEEPEAGRGGTGSLDEMEPGWIVALRFAELVAEGGHAVTDAVYAKLARVWSDGAIVEMTLLAGICCYLARFADALQVPMPSHDA